MQEWAYKMMMNSLEFIHQLPVQSTLSLLSLFLSSFHPLKIGILCVVLKRIHLFIFFLSLSFKLHRETLKKISRISFKKSTSKCFELISELPSLFNDYLMFLA